MPPPRLCINIPADQIAIVHERILKGRIQVAEFIHQIAVIGQWIVIVLLLDLVQSRTRLKNKNVDIGIAGCKCGGNVVYAAISEINVMPCGSIILKSAIIVIRAENANT